MQTTLTFDADLLRRHDQPGPRYTSYPSAVSFGPSFDEGLLRQCIRDSNAEPIPRHLSLYIHVPYCFSPCFYCGCNRIITRDVSRAQPYLERLLREIETVAGGFDRDRELVQVHLGGGTPNFLRPAQLGALLDGIRQHFNLAGAEQRDVSIEIDPRFIDPTDIACYAKLGFNRASLGVQDFDPDVQRAVNRIQSVPQTLDIIAACRDHGFESVNVDLIYGLPKQTRAGFERTLQTVLTARPERLAIYSYAHLPQLFKAQRRIAAGDLPSAEDKLGLLQLAIERLTAAGYVYIGMDHFALPTDALARAQAAGTLQRNFMGYTTHADCDLIGVGVSAISHIGDCFSQNHRGLYDWEAAVDTGRLPVWRGRTLSFDDVVRAELIQQLMCQGQVRIQRLEQRFAIDFAEYFAEDLQRLQALVRDGLVKCDAQRITATSRGRLLLRIIAMCFDRYLHQPQPQAAPAFSRVI